MGEAMKEAGEKSGDLIRNIQKLEGDAGESFKALGFRSVAELKPLLDLGGAGFLDELVKRFEQIENPLDRTGVAMRLFGDEAGETFGVMLNKGEPALRAIRQRAIELNRGLSDGDLLEMQQFRATWKRVEGVLVSFSRALGFGALPVVRRFVESLARWLEANEKL
ncbi:MAG: hypothetical protein AAFU79_17650, partial [Myxococcota bacterium]